LTGTLRIDCGVNIVAAEEETSCCSCRWDAEKVALLRTWGVWSRDSASTLENRSSLLQTRLHSVHQKICSNTGAVYYHMQFTLSVQTFL